ncbi:hypothetical protein ABBQ38_002197 [Trebouxia sp. C0009 RCD-2024]
MRREWLRSFGTGILGLGLGGAVSYWYTRQQKGTDKAAEEKSVVVHHCLKYGLPSTEHLRFHQNFVLSFDSAKRNAKWVLEHITKESSSGQGSRADVKFFEDAGLEPRFRSRLEDYRNSGYDRGHLAPAANHKGDQRALSETFSMSNMSPQVGKGFNRDYWARFERFVKTLAWSHDDVYIITGPLYVPQRTPQGYVMHYPMIGRPPCLVAVPTHFYKVVLAESKSKVPFGSSKVSVGAFVMPNDQIQPDMPLTAFTVPLKMLEDVAGMKFFPGYVNDERRQLLDAAAIRWHQTGQQQKKFMKWGDRSQLQGGLLMLEAPIPPATAQKGKQGRPSQKLLPSSGGGVPGGGTQPSGVVGALISGAAQDTLHVCDAVECKLPAEDWFDSQKKVQNKL